MGNGTTGSGSRHPERVPPEVVERARAGDMAAHEELYRAFSGQVYTTARRLLVRPELAEEVVQDVFVDVIRKIEAFRGDAPVGAWIHRIAVNRSLMCLRSAWMKNGRSLDEETAPELGDARAPGDSVAGGARSRMDLTTALERLPAVSRTVVWLHDVEGYTHAEIGRLMGKTPSFSKSQLARAHARLRDWLPGYETETCDTRTSTNS